jgi:hypothetical protein
VVANELARTAFARDGEASKVDEAIEAMVLILDDLGTEHIGKTKAFLAVLDEIVNRRHALCMRTLITTNLAREEIRERYGARVYDRLRDGLAVECGGPSLRGRNADGSRAHRVPSEPGTEHRRPWAEVEVAARMRYEADGRTPENIADCIASERESWERMRREEGMPIDE